MIERIRAAIERAIAGPRARITEWLNQLQPRERWMVLAASSVAAILILWLGVIDPLGDSLDSLDRSLAVARRDAGAVGELVSRYRRLSAEVAQIEQSAGSQDTQGSVFAQLESIAVPIAGRERITAMNPSTRTVADKLTEETVELRLEGVPMRTLINLLYSIEHRDRPLALVRLSFKRQFKSPELVDATLVVARLRAP